MGRSRTGAALGMAKALKGLMVVGYVKPCGTEWLLLIGRKDYLLWWRCWRSSGVSRAQGEARYRACSRGPSLEPCGQQQSARSGPPQLHFNFLPYIYSQSDELT